MIKRYAQPKWVVPVYTEPLPAVQSKPDDPELVKLYRVEIARRTTLLAEARDSIKLANGKRKPSRKLTQAERDYLHGFAFTAEQVRAEINRELLA